MAIVFSIGSDMSNRKYLFSFL